MALSSNLQFFIVITVLKTCELIIDFTKNKEMSN